MRRLRDLGWTAHPEAREEEVYIRIVDGAEGAKCGYYFVAHRPHEVFWVHPVPLKELAAGFDEDANYDLILTQNYFAHLERFPCFANNSIRASDLAFQYNLRDFLVSAVSKELTVSQSTSADLVQIKSPWVDADPKTYLDLFDQLERMNNRSYQVWFVAMLLRLLFHQRNAHCCGMPNATPLWGAARI
ncbi:hypothetical protein CPB83DRAFT_853704 [Crepidotus variabilis]|uniref:Uncharacterized protein n=1 Tax=Crepidotus variabilis TaxID=179855 RepID=A0A9P6JQN7_9AGAR|nr:hypothetical protein CPB83DRAFT_853704 [Crepidotus variabilis]